MIENERHIESQSQGRDSKIRSEYRGYIENPKTPLEVIPYERAKETIESELKKSLSKAEIDESQKGKIRNIVNSCFQQLDQNEILSGHIRGIIKGFIPALLDEKDCVESFFDPNAFLKGFEHEPDGISVNDFIFQSLTRKCKPSNFSRLVYRSKEMPTIDSRKILQNRKDGILLGKKVHFNALREMIHDQKNAGLPTISAMIKFYETGDFSNLEMETAKWHIRYPDDDLSPLINRSLYDNIFLENDNDPSSRVRTIDVLYRLQENLSFIGFEAPETPDQELNESLQKTSANFSYPSLDSVNSYTKSLYRLNGIFILAIQKNQIGIDPSYIAAANWLRERIGKMLGEIPFEVIETIYKEDSLKETLRLMELTANSSPYNEEEFESFVSKYQAEESFQQAYKHIYKRSVTRQSKTIEYFKNNVSSEYKFGGNLTINELTSENSLANETIEKQLQSLDSLMNHRPNTNKGRDRYHEALGMHSPNVFFK